MRLPTANSKTRRVLDYLLAGKSSNRFEAERRLHEHCLHSTVATLQNDYGIQVARKFEVVPGYQGNATRCCRYWIEPEERKNVETRSRQLQKEKALTTSDETKGKDSSNAE